MESSDQLILCALRATFVTFVFIFLLKHKEHEVHTKSTKEEIIFIMSVIT